VIARDVRREARVFRLDGAQARQLAEGTATLEGVLARRPARQEIVQAVADGFERAFGITVVPGELGTDEAELAASLAAGRCVGGGRESAVRT
jgi:hypothetical protein